MAADHAEFLVTYYTPEGGRILDPFMGRATNGFACLEHGREFIGYDVFDKNINRTQQVMEEYYPDSKFQLFHSDGTELAELKDKSECEYFQESQFYTEGGFIADKVFTNYKIIDAENIQRKCSVNLSATVEKYKSKEDYKVVFDCVD